MAPPETSVELLRSRWQELLQRVAEAARCVGRDPADIRIVAVSKGHPPELVELAIQAGIRCFGENYAQEMHRKADYLRQRGYEAEWHFIGHVQTNKVKLIAPIAALIHGVDSQRAAEALNRWGEQHGVVVPILLQVNTSGEASKHGCQPEAVFQLAEAVLQLRSVRLLGLMTIPAPAEAQRVRQEFRLLRHLRDELRQRYGSSPEDFPHLSMGMSADYELAVEEGATLLRIGTALFGERPPKQVVATLSHERLP
ncbi:MAG: YggS family pyridoxal phosphate-dependent enzyme [Candidatus Kapabacteria bacterium]|nr:YggS family pyridoxal phosphate-dependent enzyme [Candidatus Kapabacteria bacterium]MDW8011372.1 YggS family pyridoxal phosphate-dependent enzyme [Bacteroidota bacterium]